MSPKNFLRSFLPHTAPVSFAEKFRSALMAGMAVLLLGLLFKLLPPLGAPPLMLGSMAAAALLLFATPHSPMAQPWPLVCGNAVSAVAAMVCSRIIPDAFIAASAAVGLAIFLMHLTRSLHVPGAATALIWVLGGAQFNSHGWLWTAYAILANTGIMLVLALIINNLIPGRRYPAGAQPAAAAQPESGNCARPEAADIAWAASRMDSALDVSVEDLCEIYELAAQRAMKRPQPGASEKREP